MSEARVNNLSNESNTGGPTISGITTFSGTNYFVPPVGTTAERPVDPEMGSFRFNTDLGNLEFYRGSILGWVEVQASNQELNGGIRILACGGYSSPAYLDTIDYFADAAPANAVDFGNLTSARSGGHMGCGSATRGLVAGDPGGYYNIIDYITITSTGNAVDFGDCIHNSYMAQGGSSTTRGIIAGGDSPTSSNVIEYITVASTGNGTDFGDLNVTNVIAQGGSNAIRMIIPYCKDSGGTTDNTVQYITIATLGNALDFGDLITTHTSRGGAASRIHYYSMGAPSGYDGIEQCTIATTGNFLDFANLSAARHGAAGVSNGHGGL